jgi:hypothetical protein
MMSKQTPPLPWFAALVLTFAALTPIACQKKPPKYGPSEAQVRNDRLGKLRNEILGLTPPRGCEKVEQCKALGLGYNRCGGPRQYVVYCGQGADEGALQEKTAELLKLEEEEATHQGEPPPCKKMAAPPIELVDGSCRAK